MRLWGPRRPRCQAVCTGAHDWQAEELGFEPRPSHSKDCSTALHKFSSFSLDLQSLGQSSILILRRIALHSRPGSHSELPWAESTTCTLAQCLPFREQTRILLFVPGLLLQTSSLTSTSLCREPSCSISFLGGCYSREIGESKGWDCREPLLRGITKVFKLPTDYSN